MKPNPPPGLEDYQYNDEASRVSLPIRVVGWLSLIAFGFTLYSFIFPPLEQKIRLIPVSSLIFILLFGVYSVARFKKRHIHCVQCRQAMDMIDVQYTPAEWQKVQGYELPGSFSGADGCLYDTYTERRQSLPPRYIIYTHNHQWCACRLCHLYFLAAPYWRGELLSTTDKDKFEEVMLAVRTDKKAKEKIELAYKEKLEELRKA